MAKKKLLFIHLSINNKLRLKLKCCIFHINPKLLININK